MTTTKLHTFAICAYKQSEHLEGCIQSILEQTDYSEVIICTSTPSDWLTQLAERYELPLFVRTGASDIQEDWNFAANQAQTPWVTVAHQDDLYDRLYAKRLVEAIKAEPQAIMAFTDYLPIKNGEIGTDLNSRMKRLFRTPMRIKFLRHQKWAKKYFQGFGNAISCPSVAYNKAAVEGNLFTSPLKFALDWDTFVKFAGTDRPFIYLHEKLFYYRVHDGATSKEFTQNNTRQEEEWYMFRQFWPDWMIKLGFSFYQRSYKTYD